MSRLCRVFALGLSLFCLRCAAAQAPATSPPIFVVDTTEGPLPAAPLTRLAEGWTIQVGGKEPRNLTASQWLSLRQAGVALPPFPCENCLLLTSGDRILLEPAASFRVEDERLFCRSREGAAIAVPLAYVSYLCRRPPQNIDDPLLFLGRLAQAKRPRDVMYLISGDSIEGTLVAPAQGPKYGMRMGERVVQTPLEQLAILGINTEFAARPKVKSTFAHLITKKGARLHFTDLRLDTNGRVLKGTTLFRTSLQVPLQEVAALTLHQGSAVYLSDLTPARYQFTPFTSITWLLARDGSVTGKQLCVGGDFYDKGLGMHSQSQATYSLGGKYRWFDALVGLDYGGGAMGQARISVLLDGRLVVSRKELSGREPTLPVRIDVRKAREMTLVVEFGDFGATRGRVNWANARLIH